MTNSSKNHTPLNIEKICIYSPVRSIDNIMLCEKLEGQLNLPCQIATADSLRCNNILQLFDCSETSITSLHQWLNQTQEEQPPKACGLINVAPGGDHERFIEWPQVLGIFHDYQSQAEVASGLEKILAGELHFPIKLCHQFLAHRRRAPSLQILEPLESKLTRREWQIMEGIYAGYNNHKIANTLFLSQHTVKSHLYNAYKKLGVTSRLEACAWMRDNYPAPART